MVDSEREKERAKGRRRREGGFSALHLNKKSVFGATISKFFFSRRKMLTALAFRPFPSLFHTPSTHPNLGLSRFYLLANSHCRPISLSSGFDSLSPHHTSPIPYHPFYPTAANPVIQNPETLLAFWLEDVAVGETDQSSLLARLEVVDQDGALLGFLAPVAYDDAGTVDNLARIAFTVEDTCLQKGRERLAFGTEFS